MASAKECSKCKQYKELTEFSKDKHQKSGFSCRCKVCRSLVKQKLRRVCDLDENKLYNLRKKRREAYHQKKIKDPNINKKAYWKNPENFRKAALKTYYTNKEKIVKQRNIYRKTRESKDINFKLSNRLRSRLYIAIKKNYKTGSSVKDLGCNIEYLKIYLENKFDKNMSWDNYGSYWCIDHIIPLSLFNLNSKNCFLKACNYTNLQPKEKISNIKKGGKIEFC
jgi:hypothetical protein